MANLRAIDLYSGVGGWSLGLKLAGIDVVASFERWGPANETNFKNNRHQTHTVDIRRLALDELPKNIDIVVGSPPCTEFSFSNRGGNGNLADGLQDIIMFLTIVDAVRPACWAMENVPRVAGIILEELKPGGRLDRFAHLGLQLYNINMEDFGLPQRRHRCIAGNLNFALLASYSARAQKVTLGQVVSALAADPVIDPLYAIQVPKAALVDHLVEAPLNYEEMRINRANKLTHTVYNSMPFPDRLDRSVRTITATCTRVSRESIVISDPKRPNNFRRLSVRERASLQGFPITFQFYGDSYSQKLRMVGNAVPPFVSYLIGHAMKGTPEAQVPQISDCRDEIIVPSIAPIATLPDRPGSKYSTTRRFKFAIPSLQLKSGVRFELTNQTELGDIMWTVNFYFGTSKEINSLSLAPSLNRSIMEQLPALLRDKVSEILQKTIEWIHSADVSNMQRVWCHRGVGGTTPFMMLDKLDEAGEMLKAVFTGDENIARNLIECALSKDNSPHLNEPAGLAKLHRNAPLIAAGLFIGTSVNEALRLRDGYGRKSVNVAVAS